MYSPQNQSILHYNEAFKYLKEGISNDERKNYLDAVRNYEFGLNLLERALKSRDFSALTESQVSNAIKHQELFRNRLVEIKNSFKIEEVNKQDDSQKGWVQSILSFFGGSSDDNQSSDSTNIQPTPSRYNSNIKSNVDPISQFLKDESDSPTIFKPFRKQGGPSILKVSDNDYNVPRRSNDIDLTKNDYEFKRDSNPFTNLRSSFNSNSNPNPNSFSNQKPLPSIPQNTNQQKHSIKDLLKAPELRGVDKALLDRILDDVVETAPQVSFDDIGGLEYAKQVLRETVIFPQLRPDLFNGLRTPTRGILLHGPPGTGKTLLARCVASNVKATFFNISASSLNSKYHGEGEKIVKALFAAARFLAPSVIFIDEVDSILTSRSESEHEASRRLKTQILIELDGILSIGNDPNKHMLVMAATNRPHELDDAALRRFPKRIYIGLPEPEVRLNIIKKILSKGNQSCKFSTQDYDYLSKWTEGYSGSDLNELCREAVMLPLREVGDRILEIKPNELRPVQLIDFKNALSYIKPTANQKLIQTLEEWNREHGSGK